MPFVGIDINHVIYDAPRVESSDAKQIRRHGGAENDGGINFGFSQCAIHPGRQTTAFEIRGGERGTTHKPRHKFRARSQAEGILSEARKTRESMEQRMRDETETERQRRLEETRKEIAAETARALEQIRSEVADLTLEAASRVVGRTLDSERDRELISEAIGSLDFSRLEESA